MRQHIFFAIALILMECSTASAKPIDEHTPCSVAVNAYDARPLNKEGRIAVSDFVALAFQTGDLARSNVGKSMIWTRHSTDGKIDDLAMVLSYCRKDPSATILSKTVEVYRGLVGLESLVDGKVEVNE